MNVVIVGAGPAGATLALLLARAGVSVTLLDRADWPRDKPCGDCLSAAASTVLDRLGLLDAVHAARPACLAGWRIVAPAGHAFEARFDQLGDAVPHALALRRSVLDHLLLDAARTAGADVRTRCTVTDVAAGAGPRVVGRGPAGGFALRPDFLVGADGLRSVVARRLGVVRRRSRVRKVSLTAHIEAPAPPGGLGEMHVAGDLCAGLAPVGGGRCNLTVVAESDRHAHVIARDPRAFLVHAIARFRVLPERLRGARIEGARLHEPAAWPRSALLASGPFDVPVGPIAGPGWALVGDAAGYFDPFTGQGIHHALCAAERLAHAILELRAAPADPRPLRGYAVDQRRLTGPARTLQRGIDHVVRHPRLADSAIRRLARAPDAARALLAVTGDLRPVSSLLSPGPLLSFALPRTGSTA